ncbi:hypothetical protein niasHT_030666 [Heterodera trifolii]|uniref:PDZ domain-containing protein n=1 Tax=Heterodera trifolii TaxID=157864 RepID=A0ABD2HST0_9BILA
MLAAHSSSKSDYITVLAIYDDPPSKNKQNTYGDVQPNSKLSIPISGTPKSSGKDAPNHDAHSTVDSGAIRLQKESFASSSADAFAANKSPSILRNSGKKIHNKNESYSVHFEANGQNSANARLGNSFRRDGKWNGNSRKSRIANSFLDAKESIESEMNEKWPDFDRTLYQLQRIVLSSDTLELPLGLEVSPVPNQSNPSKLLAVEVRSIEEKGRIADDGRLRVGDQLVKVNETSCDMISFARVQLRLRELQSIPNPSFAFFRRISQPKHSQKVTQRLLPVTTALQIGNTSQIGETKSVQLRKGEDGFGFTYAGRESFANNRKENLYYVKGLRKECGGIAIGDRILQIDQMSLSEKSQFEVTALLKSKSVGDVIELLISRNVAEEPKQINPKNQKEDTLVEHHQSSDLVFDSLNAHFAGSTDLELQCLEIPLNDTPGAGLGLSLKAQRVGATDSGLFIRSILHGSAAFKDGRLQVNDRLVGIENQNLLNYELNGEALEAFMRTISQLPQTKHSLRLFVLRKMHQSRDLKPFGGGARRGSDSDLSQLSNFDREAPSRRSISEKRSLVTRRDPSQLRTYQRIVHQRQISAPALSSTAVANSTRSRRSLYDDLRRVRSTHSGPSAKKQRPKTMFYVDESGVAVTSESGFSSTYPPHTVNAVTSDAINNNNNGTNNAYVHNHNLSGSEPWHSEKDKAMPSSMSHPLTLSEFARTVNKNRSAYAQCHDESEPKQTKNRRGSLGNGLFKLFGRGSTHKEKGDAFCRETEGAARTQQRPPPPPYRLSPAVQQQQQHCPPCQCSPIDHYCHQQCSHINSDPMANFGLHHRTNNCTRLHQFYRSSFHPTPINSSGTSDRHRHFRSPHFGLAEVPHSRDDSNTTTTMCNQHQQWLYPIQSFRQTQRQDMPTQPSQLAWTTMIRSTPGSLPGRVPQDFSAVSEGVRQQRQQSLLFRSKTIAKPKANAVFYDQCSDWVIRC